MAFTYLCNLSLASSIFFVFVTISSLRPMVTSEPGVSSYIVHTDEQARPSQFPTQDDWYASMIDSVIDQKVQSLSGSRIFYTYDVVFKGFAARLTDQEAEKFANMPEVISVFHDKATLKLDTTRSPDFLGLNHNYGLWPETNYGEDIVIGVVDTGIWPESGSFDDSGLGPVPSRWKGACEEGDGFNSSNCNKKLIGARFFLEGFKHSSSNDIVYHISPRDDDGHGTHVASTAAGTEVANANTFGFASGTARGIASKARIAMYKACWQDCSPSDTFAAIEGAIKDGVDILSVSIGHPEQPYYENLIARAAFAAVQKNIFVCCSAGNDGPGMSSVHNAAPWITTVGSGSMDRSFPVEIQIADKSFVGSSLYPGKIINGSFPLVNLGYCGFEKTVPNDVAGKIAVCSSGGVTQSFEDGKLIHEAGGVGLIELNSIFNGEEVKAIAYTLPSLTVGYREGLKILSYINSTRNPTVSFRIHNMTVVGKDRAPIVATSSSRGPNPNAPEILKPDHCPRFEHSCCLAS